MLKALNQLAIASQEAADKFVERVYPEVKNEINNSLNNYKKDLSLSTNENESEKVLQIKYRVFAA